MAVDAWRALIFNPEDKGSTFFRTFACAYKIKQGELLEDHVRECAFIRSLFFV
jgi:hypothetical protein